MGATFVESASMRGSSAIDITKAVNTFGSGEITGSDVAMCMEDVITADMSGMTATDIKGVVVPITRQPPMSHRRSHQNTGHQPSNGSMLRNRMVTLDH